MLNLIIIHCGLGDNHLNVVAATLDEAQRNLNNAVQDTDFTSCDEATQYGRGRRTSRPKRPYSPSHCDEHESSSSEAEGAGNMLSTGLVGIELPPFNPPFSKW